jgi:hypothetical protein
MVIECMKNLTAAIGGKRYVKSMSIDVHRYNFIQVDTQVPLGATVCPIIVYTDETQMDGGNKVSNKPIYVTCGNLPASVRQSDAGKKVAGMFPKISG